MISVICKSQSIKKGRWKKSLWNGFMKKFPIKLKIVINYKLFKKFNKSKLHIHQDTYNAARHKVKEIVFNENCTFSEKKKLNVGIYGRQ